MNHNREYHRHISDYLESQKKDIITDDFAYSTYTSPNTMFNISNDLPELMIAMQPTTLKIWLRMISLIRRSHDPVLACTVHVKHTAFKDIAGRTAYYKALKQLTDMELLIKTKKVSMFIVSIKYANKLFKPKFDIP